MLATPDLRPFVVLGLISLVAASGAQADDWPQFRGPNRDGISTETGLLREWPSEGPQELWRRDLGAGYSAVSIVGDTLYTMFSDESGEYAIALAASDGSELWRHRLDDQFTSGHGHGPRATPTVADGVVFAHGARSQLAALDATTGDLRWQRNLKDDFGARVPRWGASSSPLVEGDLLIVDAGGETSSVLGLDKRTGVVVWSAVEDQAGYSSPVAVTVHDKRQVLALTANRLVAIAPEDGEVLWSLPWKTSWNVNATMPVFVPPSSIFLATGYRTGAALIDVKTSPTGLEVHEVWRNPKMRNQFSNSVVYDGYVYGFDNTTLRCLDLATGEERWAERGYGHGSLTVIDGQLLVLSDRGELLLASPDPGGFVVANSTTLFQGKTWTVPTFSEGRLFVRDGKELLALDLKAAPAD